MEHSSLIKFIEKYRDTVMNHTRLKQLWKTIDKEDFDNNEEEVFLWFQSIRNKSRLKR